MFGGGVFSTMELSSEACAFLQEAVVNVLCGRDVMTIGPTGAGKMVCLQLPALAARVKSCGVVVTPLRALMEEQAGVHPGWVRLETGSQCGGARGTSSWSRWCRSTTEHAVVAGFSRQTEAQELRCSW